MVERTRESAGPALARLLAREADWLARAPEEPLAAERARHGLAWLSALASAHDAGGAAAWFDALAARAPAEGAAASLAWRELGAPRCASLADRVAAPTPRGSSAATAFAALAHDAFAWADETARVRAWVEPPPAPAPASAPEPPPLSEPAPVPPLFLAVAAFAVEREPRLTLSPGRVEIAGELGPGELAPGALAELDRAARAAGAAVEAHATANGALAWRVLARGEDAPQHVFVAPDPGDAPGPPALAVPVHRVLEPAALPGTTAARVVLGHGLRRCALDAATRASGLPAGLARVGQVERPGDGPADLVEVVDDAATAGWAAEPALHAPAEAVQAGAVPADDRGETPRPLSAAGNRALVADDSLMARVFLARLLAQEGLEVEGVESGEAARAALAGGGFAFAFLDLDMPGGGALDVLAGLDPAWRARVCTLVKDEDERDRVSALGMGPALLKPFAEDEVRAALAVLRGEAPGPGEPDEPDVAGEDETNP